MTKIELLRLLIPDLDPDDQIFTDTELNGFLSLWGENVHRAAGSALLALASDEAKLRKIRTDDLQVDGPATAAALRENAKLHFNAANEEDMREADGGFMLVYPDFGEYVHPEATAFPYI